MASQEAGASEGYNSSGSGGSTQQPGEDDDAARHELPDASIGLGVRWDLRKAADKEAAERKRVLDNFFEQDADEDAEEKPTISNEVAAKLYQDFIKLEARCEALLEQALSGSEHGDVTFRFEDGRSPLTGHRAVLCAASEHFAGMFRSGMVEERKGIIGVPPGMSEAGYRGLLEWLYLGRAGEECARADGRELWVLSEMYQVAGMREWLYLKGINGSNLLGAYEFGRVDEGLDREVIQKVCFFWLECRGWAVEEEELRGVGMDAIENLALIRADQGEDFVEGRRLGWRCVRDAVRLLERWVRANGGGGEENVAWYQNVVRDLNFEEMPLSVFCEEVSRCEYVDGAWAAEVVERKRGSESNRRELKYKVMRTYDQSHPLRDDPIDHLLFTTTAIALEWEATPSQRMAVADCEKGQISIVNVESGELVATFLCRTMEFGRPQMFSPQAISFSRKGELYVVDFRRGGLHVFDREGEHLREVGGRNPPGRYAGATTSGGVFAGPAGLCCTADGHLIVGENNNDSLKVIQEDGALVRLIEKHAPRAFRALFNAIRICEGPNGSIAVLDSERHRVNIIDKEGKFVRSIGSEGVEQGRFHKPTCLCVGPGGEIFVYDAVKQCVQVFDMEGELLHMIGAGLDSNVELSKENYHQGCSVGSSLYDGADHTDGGRLVIDIAVDAGGRLFVIDSSHTVRMLC